MIFVFVIKFSVVGEILNLNIPVKATLFIVDEPVAFMLDKDNVDVDGVYDKGPVIVSAYNALLN